MTAAHWTVAAWTLKLGSALLISFGEFGKGGMYAYKGVKLRAEMIARRMEECMARSGGRIV